MKRLVKGKLYYQLYDYLKFNDNYDIDIEELGENEVQFSSSSIKIFDNLENALCKFSKEYPNQIIIFEIIENKNGISGYYLVKLVNLYIKNECGGQGKCAFNNLTDFEPAYYGWNPVFQDGGWNYIFPPLYSLKHIKLYYPEQEPGFRDYSIESIFRTLKYGLLRTDEYDRLSKDLVKDLYYE